MAKTVTKPFKNEAYKKEQDAICASIFNILGIDEKNNSVIINNVSEEKKQKIINMIPDIKKYFKSGGWSAVHKTKTDIWLALAKAVAKACGYTTNLLRTREKKSDMENKNNTDKKMIAYMKVCIFTKL